MPGRDDLSKANARETCRPTLVPFYERYPKRTFRGVVLWLGNKRLSRMSRDVVLVRAYGGCDNRHLDVCRNLDNCIMWACPRPSCAIIGVNRPDARIILNVGLSATELTRGRNFTQLAGRVTVLPVRTDRTIQQLPAALETNNADDT